DPQRSATTKGRIFDYTDRGGKFLFNLLASLLFVHNQPARWTLVCLADDQFSRLRIIGLFNQTPDLSSRITEARERTEIFRIAQGQRWTLKDFGPADIGSSSCRLRSIEPDFRMRTIAERLVFCATHPAETILLPCLNGFPFLPVPRNAFLVGRDYLDGERYIPRNDV